MDTVETLARHIAALVDMTENVRLIGDWVSRRYQEIAGSSQLRALRKNGELVIPAPYSTGTVTTTRGSAVVTGVSTVWDSAMVGRYFRSGVTWYKIAQVQSATVIELEGQYAEIAVAAGAYKIVQRFHSLAVDARFTDVTFTHMRIRRTLSIVNQTILDSMAPDRHTVGAWPLYVSEAESHPETGLPRVEIYPYSDLVEEIHYLYWPRPKELAWDEPLPQWLDLEAFREGVLIDVYRYKAAKAADGLQIEVAAYWRNEYRAQMTTWKDALLRIYAAALSNDDQQFVMQRGHQGALSDLDISTARDYVWLR